MDNKKTVSNIAETILGELENFGSKHEIRTPPRSDVFATAGGNIADATDPNARLGQIQATVLFSQAILKRGPFNAYVRAIIDDSREKIYFICRGYTPLGLRPSTPNSDFVSYLSPMGRIVELEPGNDDYFSLPGGDVYIEVKEKNIFRPIKLNELWDGIDNSIYLETGTFSIESLVGYLKALGLTPEEIIRLEYDEKRKYEEQLKIRIGIRRKIIDKIELRDQPILDKSQGEIFRNPLSSQLIITGAPGTGKTTLLIKRIAQKSDHKNLEDFEKAGLNDQDLDLFFNKKNWVLFTPTELLKMFLKEAFNKEWLPASDELVKVWDDERNLLGRESLRFMKVGDRGYFRKTDTQLLWDISNKALIEFASNFFSFFYNQIYDEILGLKKVSMIFLLSKELEILCLNIFKKIEEMKSQPIEEVVFALIEFLSQHRNISLEIENYLNNEIESMANAIIGDNPTLIGKILSEIETNKQFSEESVFEDEEEDQAESEIEPPTGQESITAKRRIKKVIRSYSINLFKQRSFSKNSLQFKILELIIDRLPKKENLEKIGQQIVESRHLANITTGYRIILRRVPYYYQRYRLEILFNNIKYLNKDFEIEIKNKKISDHEMDLIIYFILKNAKKVFDNHPEYLHTDTKNDILENIKNKVLLRLSCRKPGRFSG